MDKIGKVGQDRKLESWKKLTKIEKWTKLDQVEEESDKWKKMDKIGRVGQN